MLVGTKANIPVQGPTTSTAPRQEGTARDHEENKQKMRKRKKDDIDGNSRWNHRQPAKTASDPIKAEQP